MPEKKKFTFVANGLSVEFPGFTAVYPVGTKEEILPDLAKGDAVSVKKLAVEKKETAPPARFTEAALVKKLEEEGIGRPSTYAPTISAVIGRGYLSREEKALVPSDTAFVVTEFLEKHFSEIVDLKFTAGMEEKLDAIAEEKVDRVPFLREFWEKFSSDLETKDKEVKKEDVVNLEEVDEKCPDCGKPLLVKLGRFGKFLSCSGFPECKFGKPLLAEGEESPPEPEVTDEKCEKCGEPMVVKVGRFGKFLSCSAYPKCKNTKPFGQKKTGVACVKCGKGEIVEKKTRRGRTFFSCDKYPDCKAAYWQKPTGGKCELCGDLLVSSGGKEGAPAVCGNPDCEKSGRKNK